MHRGAHRAPARGRLGVGRARARTSAPQALTSARGGSWPRSPTDRGPALRTRSSRTSRRTPADGATSTSSCGSRPSLPEPCTRSPQALVRTGLASQAEVDSVMRAADVVSAARWELGRAGLGQRMTLDAAESLLAVDAGEVQRALAETALVLLRVRARASGGPAVVDRPLSAAELFALLDAGEPSLPPLEQAAQAGRLDELAPGFRELMTLRRPGLGHRLTVGAHSLVAAASLVTPTSETALARSRAAVGDLRVVQTAALAHDAGKTRSGSGPRRTRSRTRPCAGREARPRTGYRARRR